MKNTLPIILLFILTSYFTQAQDYTPSAPKKIKRVGLQIGANMPSMVFTKINDPAIYPDFESFTRLNAGIYSETGATENFVFHIGLFYSGAGYKTENETLTLDYVQVPFVFNFRTDLYENLFLQIGGGFYGGYAFAGKSETDNEIDRDILSLKKEKATNPFYALDAGLLLKADFEYTFNNDKIVKLGVGYNFGIVNVSNEYTVDTGAGDMTVGDIGAKNRIFSINATYLINMKKDKDQ